jgi:hypothetical protein
MDNSETLLRDANGFVTQCPHKAFRRGTIFSAIGVSLLGCRCFEVVCQTRTFARTCAQAVAQSMYRLCARRSAKPIARFRLKCVVTKAAGAGYFAKRLTRTQRYAMAWEIRGAIRRYLRPCNRHTRGCESDR